MKVTRRKFIKATGATTLGLALGFRKLSFGLLKPIEEIENPLAHYPHRDWEKIYRDQYRYDSTFSWVCSPNDTHACRVTAYVRNGVVIREGEQYDYQTYKDVYGNNASPNWNPRQCAKGYTFHRLAYGPYRLKYPLIRQGGNSGPTTDFPNSRPS
jgi:nitrate reductase alpha subunit